MLKFNNNQVNYNFNLCQQCGACSAICPKNAISYTNRPDGLHDIIIDTNTCVKCGKCINICPANSTADYENYFNNFDSKSYFLGYNKNAQIRKASSSGGVCKTIITESIDKHIIDGVYSLKNCNSFPYASGEYYDSDNRPDYSTLPNSVYHSVMACQNINDIKQFDKLMVVGTACQLRAITNIIGNKCKELIKICIFCKQQKTIESTKFLARIMGTEIPDNYVFSAKYRGQGWPGMVEINNTRLPYSRASLIPFGRRLWTVPGCNICGDPFGILATADTTLMDPWNIEKENDLGKTLVVVHTQKGYELLKKIEGLNLESITYNTACQALSIKDIHRKQLLIPFFLGEKCSLKINMAGKAEQFQRTYLKFIINLLPKMPILAYRILYKIPDLRNLILK